MKQIEITNPEPRSFHQRIRPGVIFITIFTGLMMLIFFKTAGSSIVYLAAIIFIFYLIEILQSSRKEITYFQIKNGSVLIKYLDYNTIKTAEISLDSANFQVKYKWYKISPPHPYLQITFKNNFLLNQHCNRFWTENKIHEIVKLFEE